MSDNASSGSDDRFFVLLSVVGLAWMAFRVAVASSPTLAGDEYAYFAPASLYPHIGFLYSFDPGLQRVGTSAFHWIASHFFLLGLEPVFKLSQLWHCLLYVGAVYLLSLAAGAAFTRVCALRSFAVALTLPMSFYTVPFMPEVDLVFLSSGVLTLFVLRWRTRPLLVSSVSGVVLGFAMLVKPHALALVVGVLVFHVAVLVGPHRVSVPASIRSAASLLVSFVCSYLLFTRIFSVAEAAGAAPSSLADSLYYRYLTSPLEPGFWVRNALPVVGYVAAHCIVLAILFPGTITMFGDFVKGLRVPRASVDLEVSQARTDYLAITLSCTLATLAMIAVFSQQVGAASAFETGRLHGRYLTAVLPFLVPPTIFLVMSRDETLARHACGLATVSLLLLAAWIRPTFKIYPWDYPELFAFFSSRNHYGWDWRWTSVDVGTSLLVVGLLVALAGWGFRQISSICLAGLLGVVLVVGNAQHLAWYLSLLRDTRDGYALGRTVRGVLGDLTPGEGTVVAEDRYGKASSVLLGLGVPQHVITMAAGTTLGPPVVGPGSKWILTLNPHPLAGDFVSSLKLGPARLYLLDQTPSGSAAGAALCSGRDLRLALADPATYGRARGFNDREDWGAWSRADTAEVLLPCVACGRLRVRILGWASAENPGPLRVQVGEKEQIVRLVQGPSEARFEVEPANCVDRVIFRKPVVQPVNSHRPMGFALIQLSVTESPARVPPGTDGH